MKRRTGSTRRAVWCAAAAVVGAFGVAAPACGQEGLFSGRTMAGVRFSLAPVEGAIEFTGQRAWTWNESEVAGRAAASARRVFLSGDVRVLLGAYLFSAKRASVWIAPVDEGTGTWQVFAVLDEVSGAEGPGAIRVSGKRLPVRAVVRAPAGVQLAADGVVPERPADPLVAEAASILASRLSGRSEGGAAAVQELMRPGESRDQALEAQRRLIADLEWRLGPAAQSEPIFAAEGTVAFEAGEVSVVGVSGAPGDSEGPSAVLSRGVSVLYSDAGRAGGGRALQVSAERAVVFLEKGSDASAQNFSAGQVRGFYAEGDVVASDGEHTIRAPRVYYSLKENRALIVDAVFWTYDERRQLPLYVRAKTLEQLSKDEFRATGARLSNTPFFKPDFAIGASSVTVTRRGGLEGVVEDPTLVQGDESRGTGTSGTDSGMGKGVLIDARNITLRAGGVPFFYWPRIKGDASGMPLRDLRIEDASGAGASIKTTWNLYSLVGIEAPRNVSADVRFDAYFQRGLGVGSQWRWGTPDGPVRGGVFGYVLPGDRGVDILPTGARLDHFGDTRGVIHGEHRAELSEDWTLLGQAAWFSDPTVVPAFFAELAREHREFTNSLYLRRRPPEDNSFFFGEVRGRANDFIVNEYLLQSPGYTVAKYPDLGYVRLADDVLGGAHPGMVTWSQSYRFTQMRMEFVEPTARELGFTSPFRSRSLFGILPGETIADALRARGLTGEPVARFDSRQEISLQLAAGPVNITPFVVGRGTAYDDTFESFSPRADEYFRLWGAGGVTFSTELSKVSDSVESRVLDMHRIRHIIEPSVTFWSAATTVDRADLPVFDDEVESLAEGSAVRLGLDQTWQTQRGGPGKWRSVDVFKLSLGLVASSGDVDAESPIGRWFDYQPELSNLGETFATVEAAWQATEVLGIAGETVYDFGIGQPAKTAAGVTLRHTALFSTFAGVRYVNSQDQTFAVGGARYELTPKYTVNGTLSYDTVRSEFQNAAVEVRRRFPNVILGVSISHNNITGVSSLGVVFQPVGFGGGASIGTGGMGFGG